MRKTARTWRRVAFTVLVVLGILGATAAASGDAYASSPHYQIVHNSGSAVNPTEISSGCSGWAYYGGNTRIDSCLWLAYENGYTSDWAGAESKTWFAIEVHVYCEAYYSGAWRYYGRCGGVEYLLHIRHGGSYWNGRGYSCGDLSESGTYYQSACNGYYTYTGYTSFFGIWDLNTSLGFPDQTICNDPMYGSMTYGIVVNYRGYYYNTTGGHPGSVSRNVCDTTG